MPKLTVDFIIDQYRSGITNYSKATKEIGLWASERYVIEKYFQAGSPILDLGCGTGRTTFELHQMGHTEVIGVDLTPEMIAEALVLNDHFRTAINFQVGDACSLSFPDEAFQYVLFSFNGFMSIPHQEKRDQALREIWRVLQPGGCFIFTTHDREKDEKYLEFWREERQRWEAGERDERLSQFGDLITTSKNEERSIYIHIPDRPEIWQWLSRNGFTVQETFYRDDRFRESEQVRQVSGECRFWVALK